MIQNYCVDDDFVKNLSSFTKCLCPFKLYKFEFGLRKYLSLFTLSLRPVNVSCSDLVKVSAKYLNIDTSV